MSADRPPDLSEDRKWLDAFRRGESRALEKVFRRYTPLVAGLLRRGVRTKSGSSVALFDGAADQQDLIQEIFTRALGEKGRQGYDGLRPYATYLSGITRNVLIDELRRRGRAPKSFDGLAPPPAAADAWSPGLPLPDELAAQRQSDGLVREFVDGLAEPDRALLQVRFEQGLSQRDAAEALGASRHEVRTREDKLRARLRAFLTRKTGGPS